MRVQWAVLARFAEGREGTVNLLGGGIDTFFVPECPATIAAFFAVQFRFHEGKSGIEHEVSFETLDPHLGTVGQPAALKHTPRVGPDHPPGWEGGWLVAGPFRTRIQSFGTYTLAIVIDGERRPEASIPFRVVEAAGGG